MGSTRRCLTCRNKIQDSLSILYSSHASMPTSNLLSWRHGVDSSIRGYTLAKNRFSEGIDRRFSPIQAELSFRISVNIAVYLEPPG